MNMPARPRFPRRYTPIGVYLVSETETTEGDYTAVVQLPNGVRATITGNGAQSLAEHICDNYPTEQYTRKGH